MWEKIDWAFCQSEQTSSGVLLYKQIPEVQCLQADLWGVPFILCCGPLVGEGVSLELPSMGRCLQLPLHSGVEVGVKARGCTIHESQCMQVSLMDSSSVVANVA